MRTPRKRTASSRAYSVERILDDRFNQKTQQREFLLKWVGFPDEDNSWEPESNIESKEIIEEYDRQKISASILPNKNLRKKAKIRKDSKRKRFFSTSMVETLPTSHKFRSHGNRRSSLTSFDEIPTPNDGDSLMENDCKPVEIIGSCRGKGVTPFDYIVKYENGQVEKVSMLVCNQLFPQMVVEYFARSAGHV